MRTSSLTICYDKNYIYGISVNLQHDVAKDPMYHVLDNNKHFMGALIGHDNGTCDKIVIPSGVKMTAMTVAYDSTIRSIEIEKSDDTKVQVGAKDLTDMSVKRIDLTKVGNEIVGFSGIFNNEITGKPDAFGVKRDNRHFLTLGLIVNKCED